ncbi:helix-turn-helix domain-containing protein [Micromonospora purpureochromogenes]|uniref:helix-turn-helix domain-containing protein n=1 Tax=Micromonospora purpureochromogenes TaxID=47872 RepID=UPI0036298E69
MSIEAVSWALNDAPDVPPQCLAVLIGLANHAGANGRGAYPSQERLALYARKSVRSVQRDLTELSRRGLIRRGDQRHVAFMPPDRRPVVWDLALERRREHPASLDPFPEPRSGRPHQLAEPASDRHHDTNIDRDADRGDAHDRTGRRTRRNDTTSTSCKPSLNHQQPTRARTTTSRRAGASCGRHRGCPAHNCGPCRAERLGGTR